VEEVDFHFFNFFHLSWPLRRGSYRAATVAHETGLPIVRPMFLIDPGHREARENWWTYQYGPDLVVSPLWAKGARSQKVDANPT